MAYTYDPSQKIEQGFGKASSDIGNAFTAVIAQQQRDYNLAENTFQNIEALKKNLNIFGQKNITAKSNDLLAKTSSTILKDGKLDYAGLGEIRQQISNIGDLKAGYDIGAKEYERMLQLGIANKDNLLSFEKFYKDLSAKMGDENLIRNPQDLQKAMVDTYTSNIDSVKVFGKYYLASNPLQSLTQDITSDKTGALNRVKSNLPAGWTIDAQGKNVPPKPIVTIDPTTGAQVALDYVDQEVAKLKSSNPDLLVQLRNKSGFAGQFLTDKDLVKTLIDRTIPQSSLTQISSANKILAEEIAVTKGTFEVAHQKEILDSKRYSQTLKDNFTSIQIKVMNAKLSALNDDSEQIEPDSDLSKYGILLSRGSKSIEFGKDIKVSVNTEGGKASRFNAIGLIKRDDKEYVVGYKATGAIMEDIEKQTYGTTRVEVPYRSIIKASLPAAIALQSKDKKGIITRNIDIYNQAKIPSSVAKPIKPATPVAPPAANPNRVITAQEAQGLSIIRKKNKAATEGLSDQELIKIIENQK